MFPSARFSNIYASTEAGAVLHGRGELFTVPAEARGLVRVEGEELLLHASWVGGGVTTDEAGWYHTGDVVDVVSDEPLTIRFVRRGSDEINVGGFKVNPHEVEGALLAHPRVRQARVMGRANSVLGNVLVAEVVTDDGEPVADKALRQFLSERLQAEKVPRVFVRKDEIAATHTGKVKRT